MSITYIELPEDEIVHWKYVKRVKMPNGKWRYYYDDSNLEKQKREAQQAESKALANRSNMIQAQKSYGSAQTAKLLASTRYNSLINSGNANKSEVRAAKNTYDAASYKEKNAKRQANSATRKYKSSVERAKKLVKSYERKSVISFPRRAISIGVVAAANWINENRPAKKKSAL